MDRELSLPRLRDLDEVVAVTGDGTNDAAALKGTVTFILLAIVNIDVVTSASCRRWIGHGSIWNRCRQARLRSLLAKNGSYFQLTFCFVLDVIILDDNFASIVKAVMWGRNINDNIKKFLQFQLTTNLVALVTATVTATSNYGMPLRAIQLLWVNLIMDSMAALALGTERPTPEVLDRMPTGRQGRLITPKMIKNIGAVGLYQVRT